MLIFLVSVDLIMRNLRGEIVGATFAFQKRKLVAKLVMRNGVFFTNLTTLSYNKL